MRLCEKIEEIVIKSSRILPLSVEQKLLDAQKREEKEEARLCLDMIAENIEIAREKDIPLCQDTGMFWVSVEAGRESGADIAFLDCEIKKGLKKAAENGLFRKSIVSDPLFQRKNTGNNMPCVICYEVTEGSDIRIDILLKGFGSENCSYTELLSPTSSPEDVIEAALRGVKKAGAKPCPPMFIGIGLGGTLDKAAELSKKALVRKNEDERYTLLENRIMEKINELEIGAGGLRGKATCLDVSVLSYPVHIAGLPFAMNISCWAERSASLILKGGNLE